MILSVRLRSRSSYSPSMLRSLARRMGWLSPSMWKRTSSAVSRKSERVCQHAFTAGEVEHLGGVMACSYSRLPRRSGLSPVSFMSKHDMIRVSVRLTVVVADARVQVDLSIDVLAVLTGNTASEDVTIVDADAGDLAGVVEVRHDEFCEEIIWFDLKRSFVY